MPTPIKAYQPYTFPEKTEDEQTIQHDYYLRGAGPIIVVMQELPGIGPATLALADRLVAAGYRVVLPHLFGPIGRKSTPGNLVRVLCMRREFSLFARNASSPVVDWLKALCVHLCDQHQVKGVAVVGMCLTGNFAISLMASEAVIAAFASQPAMPLLAQSGLHMSIEEINDIKQQLDKKGPMQAARFRWDPACTNAKFRAIDEAFNTPDQERIQLKTLPGIGHSILTHRVMSDEGHPTRVAEREMLAYFAERFAELA